MGVPRQVPWRRLGLRRVSRGKGKLRRSYWIPGSYAPTLSERRDSFLRLLKNNDFKEERMTKVGLYALSTCTTLESNKSQLRNMAPWVPQGYFGMSTIPILVVGYAWRLHRYGWLLHPTSTQRLTSM